MKRFNGEVWTGLMPAARHLIFRCWRLLLPLEYNPRSTTAPLSECCGSPPKSNWCGKDVLRLEVLTMTDGDKPLVSAAG